MFLEGLPSVNGLLHLKAPVTKVCSANFALLLNDFFIAVSVIIRSALQMRIQ